MHDISPHSGFCTECALPAGSPEPCVPSTDDTPDYHPYLRRATTWPWIGGLIASHIAHQEGLMAGEDGGEVTDCRYPGGSTLARVWVRAWYEAVGVRP